MDYQTVRIDPLQFVELANLIADRLAKKHSAFVRPELTTEEAAKYCGFDLVDTFRRWAKRRRIAPIERGRWRIAALNRAMGGRHHQLVSP